MRDVKFTILTDHKNLRYLNSNMQKVVRWKLAIQEYDFVVEHIAGERNVVADSSLLRLCEQEEDELEDDEIEANAQPSEFNLSDTGSVHNGTMSCSCLQKSAVQPVCTSCATVAALHDFEIPIDAI